MVMTKAPALFSLTHTALGSCFLCGHISFSRKLSEMMGRVLLEWSFMGYGVEGGGQGGLLFFSFFFFKSCHLQSPFSHSREKLKC